MIIIVPRPKMKDRDRSAMMREVLLSRDGPCCTYCGVNLLADTKLFATMALDHFVPKRAGGPNGVENRVLACYACDRLKSGREFATLDDAREWIAGRYAELERARAELA